MPHIPPDRFKEFATAPTGAKPQGSDPQPKPKGSHPFIDTISIRKWDYDPNYVQEQLFGKEAENNGRT